MKQKTANECQGHRNMEIYISLSWYGTESKNMSLKLFTFFFKYKVPRAIWCQCRVFKFFNKKLDDQEFKYHYKSMALTSILQININNTSPFYLLLNRTHNFSIFKAHWDLVFFTFCLHSVMSYIHSAKSLIT